MSVAYTVLNQGQGNGSTNQPSDGHSTDRAPMASAETDEIDDKHPSMPPATNNTNVPHISVTHADERSNVEEDKFNHLGEDNLDGRLNEGSTQGDFRTISPSLRTPHLGLNFDTELGSIAGETIPDINVYQHKKTLAQGMMDLALFSANANQLRYVLDSYARHPYYWASVICICLSLSLQVAIGTGLIWNALYNVKDEKQICIANKINNFTVIGIFLVVVVNVFISGFGVADPVSTTTIAAVSAASPGT